MILYPVADLGEGPRAQPPYFEWKKKKIAEERKAGRESRSLKIQI